MRDTACNRPASQRRPLANTSNEAHPITAMIAAVPIIVAP